MEIAGMQPKIGAPPPSSQMAALYDRLELICWRSVPTLCQAEMLGAQNAGYEELDESAIVMQRFIVLTRAIDSMFGKKRVTQIGEERRIAGWGHEQCLASILEALPAFFTRNEDWWPTPIFIRTLLVANSMRVFTESPDLMALVSQKFQLFLLWHFVVWSWTRNSRRASHTARRNRCSRRRQLQQQRKNRQNARAVSERDFRFCCEIGKETRFSSALHVEPRLDGPCRIAGLHSFPCSFHRRQTRRLKRR
jgi:hypothetical protein